MNISDQTHTGIKENKKQKQEKKIPEKQAQRNPNSAFFVLIFGFIIAIGGWFLLEPICFIERITTLIFCIGIFALFGYCFSIVYGKIK